ncbi:metallophosphoesterase [Rhodobacteraceae bacterium KMM 6894]|nr:metallophosphoesterase [Rhodobacteraceae bacterium KMM 6894]
MSWLRAIFLAKRSPRLAQLQAVPPCLDRPVCVIGDVHGRLDLLDRLLAEVAERPESRLARIILVGDMIDRGPDSAGVLARVHALQRAAPERVICLMGNHERMLLDLLYSPARHGPRWIAAGGSETMTSFGLSPWVRRQDSESMIGLAKDLRSAMTDELVDWLAALPLIWREDRLAVSHAGADPAHDIDKQAEKRLLWGAQGREADMRGDGVWVAHGHNIVPKAGVQRQKITLDTGAWCSGRLSAVWVDVKGPSFIEVSGPKYP